jgi:beta-lactamase regulating signal transducer with metallopeptidase domain
MIPLLMDAQNWNDSLLYGLLFFALRATILLGAAWGVTRLLRSGSAATRHLIWSVGVAGVLLLPALSLSLPTIPLFSIQVDIEGASADPPALLSAPAMQPPATSVKPLQNPIAEPVLAAPQESGISNPVARSVAHGGPGSAVIPLSPVVGMAWLAIAFLLLARLAVANARVSAWQRAAMPVQDLRWLALLGQLTRQYGIRRPVVLLESPATDVPVTWGIVYPVILIPAEDAWDHEQRVAVLTHELAHVKRFDALTQQLAQLAFALLWFHPLVWMAVRRMRLEREHACDDFVLTSGARASRYADDLLGLARRLSRPTAPAAAALAMARRSELEGRLLAILDPAVKRSTVRRARVALLALGVILLATPLAAFGPGFDVQVAATENVVEPVPSEPSIAAEPSNSPALETSRVIAEPALPAAVASPAAVPLTLIESRVDGKSQALLSPVRARNAERLIRSLRAVPDTEPQRPVELQTLIDVTKHLKRMTSDHDKGLLLQQIARRYVRNDDLREAYLDAVGSMTSDHERTNALVALLDRDSLDAGSTARVLRTAALMTSDMNRGLVLKRITPATFADTTVQKAYVSVLNAMTSSTERAAAIGTLLKQPNLPQSHRLALLRATTGITSSTEKANVLMLFFDRQGIADPTVRTAFYKAAETLTSDSEYRRVMAAMLR